MNREPKTVNREPKTVFCMQSIKKYYRLDRREIAFIKFILEAYDGLAVLKTVSPADGLVELSIAPGCQKDVEDLIGDLSREILIEAQ